MPGNPMDFDEAQERLKRGAREAGMSPDEWIDRLASMPVEGPPPPLWRDVSDALDVQSDLVNFWYSRPGRDFHRDHWSAGMNEASRAHFTHERVGQMLLEAPLYVIEEEMCDLAWGAASKRADEPLLFEDLPSPSGLALFARSIVNPNAAAYSGRAGEPLCGLLWHSWPPEDGFPGMAFAIPFQDVHRLFNMSDPMDAAVARLYGGRLVMTVQSFTWPFTVSLKDGGATGTLPEAWLPRHVASLFALMNQRIAVATRRDAARPSRRRAQRAGISEPLVRVVHLRRALRAQASAAECSTVAWTHRWVVSGHWRQQWYPSLEMHRQRWINPYVKGPEDKELVTKPTVFKLDR